MLKIINNLQKMESILEVIFTIYILYTKHLFLMN
jgi:hypothetical protein